MTVWRCLKNHWKMHWSVVSFAPTFLDIINLTASFTSPTTNLRYYIVALFQFPVIPRNPDMIWMLNPLHKVIFPFRPPLNWGFPIASDEKTSVFTHQPSEIAQSHLAFQLLFEFLLSVLGLTYPRLSVPNLYHLTWLHVSCLVFLGTTVVNPHFYECVYQLQE